MAVDAMFPRGAVLQDPSAVGLDHLLGQERRGGVDGDGFVTAPRGEHAFLAEGQGVVLLEAAPAVETLVGAGASEDISVRDLLGADHAR